MDEAIKEVAAKLRKQGKRPYIIPGGGSNRIGALGYVASAIDLVSQTNEQGITIDHVRNR